MGREDTDILYEVVSAEQRRRVLTVLTEASEPLTDEQLSRRVVARQSTSPRHADASSHTQTTKVGISLNHVHLPKLEEGGAVERTAENEYVVTPLGRDLEEAAQAFEMRLDDARDGADGIRSSATAPGAVPASEYDGDAQ